MNIREGPHRQAPPPRRKIRGQRQTTLALAAGLRTRRWRPQRRTRRHSQRVIRNWSSKAIRCLSRATCHRTTPWHPAPRSRPASGGSSAGSIQEPAPHPGQDSLLLTYRNGQTGGWITLEIQPLNSPAPQPVTPAANAAENQAAGAPASANAAVNQTAGTVASANATGNQPPGADRITWQAQKNGASFLLTVTGSLPDAELKGVAASVH